MNAWKTLSRRTVFEQKRFLTVESHRVELPELSRAELEDALSAGEFKALAWAAIVALGLRRIGTLAVDVDRMPLRADG